MRNLLIILTVGLVLPSGLLAQPTATRNGGNGTFYVGVFPDQILVVDEATGQVTNEITMRLDGPPSDMWLSTDGRRMYMRDMTFEHLEVIDLATQQTLDTLTLSEGVTQVRIRNYVVSPDERYVVMLADAATKRIDRFDIAPRRLLQVDLTSHEVLREIPWPDDRERIRANMMFSSDGGLLYLFGQEIIALNTDTFTEVERWALSQLDEGGLGQFSFNFRRDPNEEPGFFTGIFRVHDPVQNRRLMGVARINLAERDVDFYTLGPDEPLSSFSLAPGGQKAYALLNRIGRYEFWTFDLAGRRVEKRQGVEGRPRMAILPSSNGEIVYIHQAGNTIELYDAESYEYLRTITLDGDMTNLFLAPPGS